MAVKKTQEFEVVLKVRDETSDSYKRASKYAKEYAENTVTANQAAIDAAMKQAESLQVLEERMAQVSSSQKSLAANTYVTTTALATMSLGGFALAGATIRAAGVELSSFSGALTGLAKRGIFSVTEALMLAAPVLVTVGQHLQQLEGTFHKVAGTTLLVAGIITGSFAAAIIFATRIVGGFIADLGDGMMAAMNSFQLKAAEMEKVVKNFAFVLRGFGKEFGPNIAGTAELWDESMQSILNSTTYTQKEIQKAATFIVKEGSSLHLSIQDNLEIMKRAADIAAASGAPLIDTVQAILNGVKGQGQALFNLGINISEIELVNSKYVASLGKTVNELSELEKRQARLELIYKKSNPLLGAAANAADTLSGSYDILARDVERLTIKLGEQSFITKNLTMLQASLVQTFLEMPDSIVSVIGTLQDLLGVTLAIVGRILKYILLISALSAAYKLLTIDLRKSAYAQMFFDAVLARSPAGLKAATLSATNYMKVMGTLSNVLKAFATSVIASLGKGISVFVQIMGRLAVVLAPIILKLGLIILVVKSVYDAFTNLSKRSLVFREILEGFQNAFQWVSYGLTQIVEAASGAKNEFSEFIEVIKRVYNVVVNFVEIALVSLVGGVLAVARAFKTVKYMMASGDEAAKLEQDLAAIDERLLDLNKSLGHSVVGILSFGEQTAYAAESSEDFNAKLREQAEAAKRAQEELDKLIKANMAGFDVQSERMQRLGSEFEKVRAKQLEALREVQKAEALNADVGEKAVGIAEARKKAILAAMDVEKLRIDTLKEINKQTNEHKLDELKNSNQLVAAVRFEYSEKRKLLDEQIKGLRSLGKLSKEQEDQVKNLQKALDGARVAAMQNAAVDQLKEKYGDLAKSLTDLRKETDDIAIDAVKQFMPKEGVIEFMRERSHASATLLENELSALDLLDDRAKAIIEAYRQAADLQSAAGQFGAAVEDANPFVQQIAPKVAQGLTALTPVLNLAVDKFNDSLGKSLGFQLSKFSKAWGLEVATSAVKLTGSISGFLEESSRLTGKYLAAGAEKLVDGVNWVFGSALKLPEGISEGIANGAKIFGKVAGTVFSVVYDIVEKLFDPEFINSMGEKLNNFVEKLPENLSKAWEGLNKAFDKFLEKLPEVVSKLISTVSKGIDSAIPRILKSTDVIFDAFSTLLDALPELFAKILEGAIKTTDRLLERLPEFIEKLFSAVGKIIAQIISRLPDILSSIFERLPDIIESIIVGILDAMGSIVAAIIDLIVGGGLEKIVGAFLRMIPRLVMAFVNGVIRGLTKFFSNIWKGVSVPKGIQELPERIAEGAKKLGKDIAKETSQLFKVMDLEDKFGGVDPSKSFKENMENIMANVGKKILGFWDYLKKAWAWIDEKILQPVIKAFTAVWTWVYEGVVKPLLEGLKMVWSWVYDYVVGPMIESLNMIWQWVYQYVVQGLGNIIRSAWAGIISFFQNIFKGKIVEAFKGVFEQFGTIGSKIVQNFKDALGGLGSLFSDIGAKMFSGLKGGLDSLPKFFTDMFNKLNPANLFEKIFKVDMGGKGTVEKTLGIDIPFMKFAQGGIVPGNAPIAGDSEINDRMLALVSPGEAWIPRSAMANPYIRQVVQSILDGSFQVPQFGFGGAVGSAISGAGGAISDAGKSAGGAISSATKAAGGTLSDWAKQAQASVQTLNPAQMWRLIEEKVMNQMMWKVFEANKFHDGGFLTGTGEKPVLAKGGEFIVNPRGTAANRGLLEAINRSGKAFNTGGSTVINMGGVTINSKTNLDAESIRRDVAPILMQEIKRKSQDGRFVLAVQGVRS